jgi:putative addiction module killer protein
MLGNFCVTHSPVLEIRYYVAQDSREPFAEWYADLEPVTRARIARTIARMQQGNLSNAKSVGGGVLEYRIDSGPGYRVYFGRDGETLVILLTGGSKRRQQRDIAAAWAYWQDYKQRKGGRR